MILKCLEGMYVTYTSEIFSDPRRKKKVFVEQYLGLFLAELGLFCHFVPGLLAIALGSRLPLFIWIAGIGLGTRLKATRKQTACSETNRKQNWHLRNGPGNYHANMASGA